MITFSIITCTFQAEKEIQRTLESVAQQTYPHVEHVLVDGASRDQTTTLIEAYIAEQRTQPEALHRIVYRSGRLRVVSQCRRHLSPNRHS